MYLARSIFLLALRGLSRAFTILWLFPVSLFVGLVSIQNISAFWPGLVSQNVLSTFDTPYQRHPETLARQASMGRRITAILHPDPPVSDFSDFGSTNTS